MRKFIAPLVIGILSLSLILVLRELDEKTNEAKYYHTLHNRQTWMLLLLDDESDAKLGKQIEKNMKKDTDKVLLDRYEEMDYKYNK